MTSRRRINIALCAIAMSLLLHTTEGFVATNPKEACFQCRRPFSYRSRPSYLRDQPSPATEVDEKTTIVEASRVTVDDTSSPAAHSAIHTAPESPPPPPQQTMSLEERTRRFIYGATPSEDKVFSTEEYFQEAQGLMIGWSHRHSRRAALMVERIIRRVIQAQESGIPLESSLDMCAMYTCAIRGWANSKERGPAAQRAEEILDTLQQCYTEGGRAEMKPEIEAFNLVLLAYARSGLNDAPQQALRVLGKLHDWYTSGATDIAPNKESYATVLRAYAKTGKPDAPEHVQRLLEHLERLADEEGYECVRPDYMCHGAYISALIDSMDRDFITPQEAATRADVYLHQLMASPYEEAKPDSWIFNLVLAAWSKSYTEDMVDRADQLMKLFEIYHEWSGRSEKTRPNTVSYNFLLAAYSRSSWPNQGEKAHAILQRMQQLVQSGNNTAARPDAVTYNTVMSAYAKSRSKTAPYDVEELLREMHHLYEETQDPRMRPNCRSFNMCVNAWAKSAEPGAAARIMDWIVHMQANAEREGRRSLSPNKWTFNAFLQALAKSGEPTMGEEAQEVLDQMVEYYQKGWLELKPDVLTFTNVIHCIAVSGAEDALERSLAIVRRMEDLHSDGYGDVRPNAYTYNCVINAAAKSNRPGKAQIALQILRRMQEVALRPPTVTYNNVLNACAFANHADDVADEILDIAKEVFEEAKLTCGANYITFGAYLRVIGRFVRDGTKKKDHVFDIYRQCCDAGQLNKMVMRQMKHSLTAAQFAELRADAVIDEETGQYRPEYTVNARMQKYSPYQKKTYH